jgi:hypothetical protein
MGYGEKLYFEELNLFHSLPINLGQLNQGG